MRFLLLLTIVVLHQGPQVEGNIKVQDRSQRLTFHLELGTCPYSGNLATSSSETCSLEESDFAITTPQGCTCASACGATIGDKFKADWCTVQGSCGEWSLYHGYWDYCQYKAESQPGFSLSWRQKHDNLWNQIKDDPTLGQYNLAKMFTQAIKTSFDNEWDVMPPGRLKSFHGIGAVCPFEINVNQGSTFTGIFKPGKVTGFIRAGLANGMSDDGIQPGVGVKFMRTKAVSANFVALFTLPPIPGPNFNFFAVPLSNFLQHPTLKESLSLRLFMLKTRFCMSGHCALKNGISNLAVIDQDGQEPDAPKAPFKITLEPTEDVQFSEDRPVDQKDLMARFTSIPVGSKLYSLKAYLSPDDQVGMVLGDLVTIDNCVTSHFGDTQLFFKHQGIEEDVALNPQWTDAYYDECACNVP